MLGLSDIGLELDAAACATRAAAGHRTVRADVCSYPVERFAGAEGVVISPPCQAFSSAGNGEGRLFLGQLAADIHAGRWDSPYPERVRHVLEVGRWTETLRPRWVVAEQVPAVLPLWQAYAARWRSLYGWSCWAGLLLAADYGVPQTRLRAFLLARTDGQTVSPPEPTHCEGGASTMFGELAPWVSMADALGWHGEAATVVNVGAGGAKSQWVWEYPCTTVAGDPRITARCHHDDGSQGADAKTTDQVRAGDYSGTEPVKLTLAEALIIQSFRPDYPVQGNKGQRFEQVGNAVPPLLAAHVLAVVTGRTLDLGEAAA